MRYSPHPNVVARELDGAVVLVNLDTSRIFTLNPTGSFIWELLTGAARDKDVDALEQMLSEEYDVEQGRLHGEVIELLGQLERERLVVAQSEAP